MKSYSIDLRQKIVELYSQKKISIRALAQSLSVSKSFVQKILKQYRETGNIAPRKRGGPTQAKVRDENLSVLENIIINNNDRTLKELCQLLVQETGIKVSSSTMDRLCKKLNYTVKKNSVCYREKQ